MTGAVANASTGIFAVSYSDGRVLFFDRSGDADIPDLDLGVFAWVDDFSADGRRLTVRTADRFHVYDLGRGRRSVSPRRDPRRRSSATVTTC